MAQINKWVAFTAEEAARIQGSTSAFDKEPKVYPKRRPSGYRPLTGGTIAIAQVDGGIGAANYDSGDANFGTGNIKMATIDDDGKLSVSDNAQSTKCYNPVGGSLADGAWIVVGNATGKWVYLNSDCSFLTGGQ